MTTLIEQTATHEIFMSHFNGFPVRFIRNRETGEVNINADDAAKVLGFENLTELMSEDKALDIVNKVKEKTGLFPLREIEPPDVRTRFFAVRCSNSTYSSVYARLDNSDGQQAEHTISHEPTYYLGALMPSAVFLTDELQTLAKAALANGDNSLLSNFSLEDNTGIIYHLDWKRCQNMGSLGTVILLTEPKY